MNIVKQENNALALSPLNIQALQCLAPGPRKLIEAGLQNKLCELEPLDTVKELINVISAAITIAGQKSEPATLAIYADEFYTKVLETYPNISLDEIRFALRAGVYGEYGEFYGLNPKTFFQFVKQYLSSDERKEARNEFDQLRLELVYSNQLTPYEKETNNMEFINLLYADYLSGKLLSDFIPVYLFDFLVDKQLLSLSRAEKMVIMERAESYIKRLQHSAKMRGSAKDLATAILLTSDTTPQTISKQFAVFDFFERCKGEGKIIIFAPGLNNSTVCTAEIR